jgi:hypothetical protein
MKKKFVLLVQYPNGEVQLCRGKDIAHIVAEEGNEDLLHTIGLQLIDEGLIRGYQLAQLYGLPVSVE